MRKIAVIVGSASDLSQCHRGLMLLKNLMIVSSTSEKIEVSGVYIRSQHRNTLDTQELLRELTQMEVDVAIIGAGWANHLTGCCDAFLRYVLRNDKLVVIGVAFEDETNPKHTLAATLSISEVPGTQVVYSGIDGKFIGSEGFLQACGMAANGELPKIFLPEPKPIQDLSLEKALEKT